MPSTFTAGSVMDLAASFLNDTAKSVFNYNVQLPYLQAAYSELAKILESNNVPITNEVSTIFVITTAMTDIGGNTGPSLPSDLIEVQSCYERDSGTQQDFIEMTQTEFLPQIQQLTEALIYWSWQNETIQFLGATSVRDVQLEYIGSAIGTIVDQSTSIKVYNSKNYLAFKTAEYCAKYVGENPTRAQLLNSDAELAKDEMLDIVTKGRQGMPARRRPFLSRYKMHGGW